MNLHQRKFCLLAAVVLSPLFCRSASAQGPADSTVKQPAPASSSVAAELPDAPLPAAYQGPGPVSNYPTGATGGNWRVGISFYGWFPAVRGTVGAFGRDVSLSSSSTDVFGTLEGAIPVLVEVDKGRFLMPIDYLWLKLGFDTAIPIATPVANISDVSAHSHFTQSILTPKVGFRLLDADHFKVDALAGARYWYVSLNNTFYPSGLYFSRSAQWVDGVGGARFIVPFGEKVSITAAGDAGAGGSDLDYQGLGLLNINFNRTFALGLGWRYLSEDYRPSNHQFVYNPIINGPVGGITFNFGGKPPAPLTMSCSTSPSPVFAGDPVTVTASPTGLNPKLNAVYTWSGDAVTGSGATATVNTSGLNPGNYTVKAVVKQGKPGKEGEKPWEVADCSTSYAVKDFEPPTLSCSMNPITLRPGESATVTAQGVSPQNRPLTYSYQASSGTISGTGTSATYSAAGASAGPAQITCNVMDDRGHSATAVATVTIEAAPPQPPRELVARLTLHSVYFPTAQPTEEHPEGGLVESQQATLTALATDFKSYLQMKPDGRITLTGHADPRGTPEFNQKLSERRVARAKAFLVEQGVPETSIDTQAMGEEQQLTKEQVQDLIATNPDLTEEQRAKIQNNLDVIVLAQNRRVDIRLNGSDQESTRHYPFNAADSMTLLQLKKPVHKKRSKR